MPSRPQSRLLLVALAVAAGLGALAAGLLVASSGSRHAAPSPSKRTVAPARSTVTTAPAPPRLVVPNLIGVRLDRAKATLDGSGLRHQVKGGGVFGVLDDTNWVVCSTEPSPSSRVEPGRKVALHVDRAC